MGERKKPLQRPRFVDMTLYASRPVMVLRALLWFVRLDYIFWRSDFHTAYSVVTDAARRYDQSEPAAEQEPAVKRTLAAVETATRYYYRKREDCLPRSMTLYILLRSQRIFADLVIAVRKYPFAAHAWVEHDGRALDEAESTIADFQVLSRSSEAS